MKDDLLTIGQLAKKMDVTVRTLQYYDREGLLKPSQISDGGRRLYSTKDIIKLHQILSFKYLGFSLAEIKTKLFNLDTPQEVVSILDQQKMVIEEQVNNLNEALEALNAFKQEVEAMHSVDFKKYAEIIELLKLDNKQYWLWKYFDEPVTSHIVERFSDDQEAGLKIFATYQDVLEKAYNQYLANEAPDSQKSQLLAKRWWDMVNEFTGGDMSLVPELEKFSQTTNLWDNDLAQKQEAINGYLEAILTCYFTTLNKG